MDNEHFTLSLVKNEALGLHAGIPVHLYIVVCANKNSQATLVVNKWETHRRSLKMLGSFRYITKWWEIWLPCWYNCPCFSMARPGEGNSRVLSQFFWLKVSSASSGWIPLFHTPLESSGSGLSNDMHNSNLLRYSFYLLFAFLCSYALW